MRKKLIILLGVVCVIAAAVIFLLPYMEQKPVKGPEVLTSQRVKIDLNKFKTAGEEKAVEGAEKPATAPVPAGPVVKAPEPVKKQAAEVKPTPAKKATTPTQKPPAGKPTVAEAKRLPWAINLASFTEKGAAVKLRNRLKSAGYNAYTTEFVKDGTRWNRVRVGFYPTKEAAEKAGREIKSKVRIGQRPWVVKPPTNEVRKHLG